MTMQSLSKAFIEELKDAYNAEKQLTRALPKMAEHAAHEKLRGAFEEHLGETQQQVDRLERVFASIDRAVDSKQCEGIAGIVEEGSKLMEQDAVPGVKDAMLVGAAQKVEHYEIAAYGTLCTWADLLGHTEARDLLRQTLEEEKQADAKLTKLAEQVVNRDALREAA